MKKPPKKNEVNRQWNDSRCRITSEKTQDGRLHIFGTYYHLDAAFKFSLRQQKNGNSAMRGTISIISKKDGHIMQLEGRRKAEILKKLQEERPNYLASLDGKRIEELNLSTSVNSNSLDIDCIKSSIARGALRLYSEHATQIHRESGEIARPETITPLTAAHMHVDEFMEKNHRALSKQKFEQYRRDILSSCFVLPHVPMATFNCSMVKRIMHNARFSKQKEKLLKNFWLFCIQANICIGSLPFVTEAKKKPSPDVSIRNATRPNSLSLEDQDASYNLLYHDPNGGDCGYALMLWGGFSAKDACKLFWKDVIWYEGHIDYVRIKFYRPDFVGATHDYTAPIFPAGAKILRKRYETLRASFNKDDLDSMPIVSQVFNPSKAMNADALVQEVLMRLRTIGLQYESIFNIRKKEGSQVAVSRRLLKNTYDNNVYHLCALSEEVGTAKFLCKESLTNNTTDDHYASFSSEEAGERLHAYMSFVTPEESIDFVDEKPKKLPDGRVQHTYAPETTRQRVGHVGHYRLQPGEEIVIKCPHGAKGSVTTRAYNEDGSLRRKTQKRKNDTK